MLSSLLRQLPKSPATEPEPEDIFQYSLGLIFTDDLQIQYGDPGNIVKYRRNGYGDLEFDVADPQGEEERNQIRALSMECWGFDERIDWWRGSRKE
jgi:hypothetical protein